MAGHTITIFGLIAAYLVIGIAVCSVVIAGASGDDSLKYPAIFVSKPSLNNANFTEAQYQNITHIDYTDTWEFDETKGLYSTRDGDNKLYFQAAGGTDESISTTYLIRNPNDNAVRIIARETSAISTVYIDIYEDRLELWDKNGILYPLSLIYAKETYAVTLDYDEFSFQVDFNPSNGILSVWVDEEQVINTIVSTSRFTEAYIGLYTDGVDTCLIELDSDIYDVQLTDNEFGIIQFGAIMVSLLTTSVDDEYLPTWLNILCIHIPLSMLLLVGIAVFRGGI